MLYVTTRDDKDAFTAYRTLQSDLAPDGGCFVPFRLPAFSGDEMKSFAEKSLGQNVADILNLFFSARLTGWDVDLCIGRNLIKLASLSQKILVAEIWHNPMAKFQYIVENLYRKITDNQTQKPTRWFEIAVRVAFLFSIFSQMLDGKMDDDQFDVVINANDDSMSAAVWYARQMGLPIATIIYSCDEGSAQWNVLRRGVCSPSALNCSSSSIEQLIYNAFGPEEAKKYLLAETMGTTFAADEELVQDLASRAFAAAVSKSRLDSVISSVERTDSYRINDVTAGSFGGLQDYRASTREGRTALVIVESALKS